MAWIWTVEHSISGRGVPIPALSMNENGWFAESATDLGRGDGERVGVRDVAGDESGRV